MKSQLQLEKFFPFRLAYLSQTVSSIFFSHYQNEFTLTIPQWRVIALLGQHAPQTALELVFSSGMDKVKVSRACEDLAQMKFLSRKVDLADRRKVQLDLTTKGKRASQKYAELIRDWESQLLQCLSSDEEKVFDNTLNLLFHHSVQGKPIKLVHHTSNSATHPPFILAQSYPYRFAILAKLISDNFSEVYRDRFGLTISEWRIIAILGQYVTLSSQEVCQRTSLDKVKISRAATRLQQAGLLTRRTDSVDRRKHHLSLSPKGSRTYQQISPLALAWEQQLLNILDAQQRNCLDLSLDKLLQQSLSLPHQLN